MASNESKELLVASPKLIPTIGEHINNVFVNENYKVTVKHSETGECDILLSENKPWGVYPYQLHITMKPHGDSYIDFYARNDNNLSYWFLLIFSLILPLAWPIFILFLINLVRWSKQNKLDDRALAVAKEAINSQLK